MDPQQNVWLANVLTSILIALPPVIAAVVIALKARHDSAEAAKARHVTHQDVLLKQQSERIVHLETSVSTLHQHWLECERRAAAAEARIVALQEDVAELRRDLGDDSPRPRPPEPK